MDAEQHILCLAARTRLDGGARTQLEALVGGPVDWERVWKQGHLHDVNALVTATLRGFADAVPAEFLARGERRLAVTLLRNGVLLEELLGVVGDLRDRGVDALPVKGVVLAGTLYGSLALRPAADLDLLVEPRHLEIARSVLAARGYGHREQLLFEEAHHPYHDPQYFRPTARGEVCLELHRALWDGRHFRPQDGLFERAVEVQLGGVGLRVLSPEDTLLHLAIHRTRSPLRLRLLCDVAELLRVHGPSMAWDDLLARAARVGARSALHSALSLARDHLGAPLPPEILAALAVGRSKQRILVRTCGVPAMFAPAADDDLAQQRSLALRAFEQDGGAHIARTLAHGVLRKGRKRAYARRPRRGTRPGPERASH